LANNVVSAGVVEMEVKPLSVFYPGKEGGKGRGKGPERVWYRA